MPPNWQYERIAANKRIFGLILFLIVLSLLTCYSALFRPFQHPLVILYLHLVCTSVWDAHQIAKRQHHIASFLNSLQSVKTER